MLLQSLTKELYIFQLNKTLKTSMEKKEKQEKNGLLLLKWENNILLIFMKLKLELENSLHLMKTNIVLF
jgi:hypothetical protein